MNSIARHFGSIKDINFKNEILAGLTVAMTMIPESLSFAILAGFPPLVGLYGAFIMGFVTSIFGGRPGLISGGAGATVIVLMGLMEQYGFDLGLEYVFAAVALAGVIQILVGVLKLGKFIRLVPQSVMFGFVNGLAIIIFMSQLKQFNNDGTDELMTGMPLYTMAGLVALTIVIVMIIPKITKAIPASLLAIVVVFGLVFGLDIDTRVVGDIASVSGDLPPFHIPEIPFTMETLIIIFPPALIMASVGLTEGLLTLNLVDEMTGTKGHSNKECVAQGAANILNGFFNGMGGCPMIAQTLVNLSAGARARLSGIVASLTILAIILFGDFVIEKLPMAALTGVMMMVAIGTFEWASLKTFKRMPMTDVIVMIIVTLVTVFLHNLALAVLVGVIISALAFAWENARRIRARKRVDENGVKHYDIYGPLFFGSTMSFLEKFDYKGDDDAVIIDFEESRVADQSGIDAIKKVNEKYKEAGKKVSFINLSQGCKELLEKAKVDVKVSPDKPKFEMVYDDKFNE